MILEDRKYNKLDSYKTELLRKQIYSNENIEKYSYCPHCGHKHFINYGKYNGIQRYKCKSCNKTFSNSTKSLWKYLKQPPEKWFKFLELLCEKTTLKYCAEELEISIVTAFNWRHKILHGLENLYKPKEFKDFIFMEMSYYRRSYKGSRNKHYVFKDDFHKRYNMAKDDVYIAISYDINDEIIVKNIGINTDVNQTMRDELKEIFEREIYDLCEKKSYIHISCTYYCRPIFDYVVRHNRKVPIKIRKEYKFNPKSSVYMDNIESNYKTTNIGVKFIEWLGDFKGVATKYLNHYCSLFALNFVEKTFSYMNLFFDLLSSACVYTSTKSMFDIHPENY